MKHALVSMLGAAAVFAAAGCGATHPASAGESHVVQAKESGVSTKEAVADTAGAKPAGQEASSPAVPKVEAVAPPKAPPPAPAPGYREVFPGVRVDAQARAVQFDGIVPIDAHDEQAPLVFLEVVACTPDTKEHEALVVTQAKASLVHAAMLLIGLQPGTPGRWTFENDQLNSVPPKGDAVSLEISYRDATGQEKSFTPQEMIVDSRDGRTFGAGHPGKWVFAGSQMVTRNGREVYDADGAGTLIGLTTFGSETIAWSEMISPEAAVQEPEWVARAATVPRAGTSVTVTIRPAKQP